MYDVGRIKSMIEVSIYLRDCCVTMISSIELLFQSKAQINTLNTTREIQNRM